MQKFLPAGDYEWELEDSDFVPILTEYLTAPLELIELSVCSCNSNSTTRRYKYNKNVLICTDMCKCLYCNNNAAESNIVAPQDIEIDSQRKLLHGEHVVIPSQHNDNETSILQCP